MCRKCSFAKDAYPKDGMYLSGFAAISCAQAQNCGRLHRAFRCFQTRTFRWLIMIRSFRYLNETFVIVNISYLVYAYMTYTSKSAVCDQTIRYMNCMDLDRSLRLHAVCQSPGASMRWARWKGQPSHVVVFPGKNHEALEMRKWKPWGFKDLQILNSMLKCISRSCTGSTLKGIGGTMGATDIGDMPSVYISQARTLPTHLNGIPARCDGSTQFHTIL